MNPKRFRLDAFLLALALGIIAGGVGLSAFFATLEWSLSNIREHGATGCKLAIPTALLFALLAGVFNLRPARLALGQLAGVTIGFFIAGFFDRDVGVWMGFMGQFLGGAASCGWARSVRDVRRTTGLCAECGYNLTGLPLPRCPECGTRFDPKEIA